MTLETASELTRNARSEATKRYKMCTHYASSQLVATLLAAPHLFPPCLFWANFPAFLLSVESFPGSSASESFQN